MRPIIGNPVINILSEETLRSMSIDLSKHIESLLADGIRPAKGTSMALTEICEELQKRVVRYAKIHELSRIAKGRGFSNPAWHLIMSAIENALEKHKDGTEEFELSARASLESLLCYPNDCSRDDIEWFKSVGVKW